MTADVLFADFLRSHDGTVRIHYHGGMDCHGESPCFVEAAERGDMESVADFRARCALRSAWLYTDYGRYVAGGAS